jgi:hypothetical protein
MLIEMITKSNNKLVQGSNQGTDTEQQMIVKTKINNNNNNDAFKS